MAEDVKLAVKLSPHKRAALVFAERGSLYPHAARSRRTRSVTGVVWCHSRNIEAGDGHEVRCDRISWPTVRALDHRGLLRPASRFGDDPQSWSYEITEAGRAALTVGR